jgi:hypothetical protein
MLLDDKPFEQLCADDIQALIPAVTEGRRIDYKRELPDDREKSIRSLLNDVSALANSAGGYLVYGVEEEQDEDGKNTGVPSRVCGVGNLAFDQVQLAWEQRIKQNIEPTIIGYRVRFIHGFKDGEAVMVIFVPRSLLSPHWTNYAGKREFRVRHDRGNQMMELDEIRHSFVEARQIPERVDEFRRLRASKVLAHDTPIPLRDGRTTIIHLVPITALQPDPPMVDTSPIEQLPSKVLGSTLGMTRPNFNGRLYHDYYRGESSSRYMQVYRDGRVEIATRGRLEREQALRENNGVAFFIAPHTERDVIQSVAAALAVVGSLGIQPPVYVCLTLLGVKDMALVPRSNVQDYFLSELPTFDEDMLFLPPVVAESVSEDVSLLLRPVFDVLWQSSGLEGSSSYNDEGKWEPK